jgi:hypothetical protein
MEREAPLPRVHVPEDIHQPLALTQFLHCGCWELIAVAGPWQGSGQYHCPVYAPVRGEVEVTG